jgi:carbon-monoxide dehydrogenase medium subunit
VKAAPFEYDAPTTPAEAVALLSEHGDEAKVLAGGQSLIPMLALRLAFFDRLVDIGRIPALRGVEDRGDSVWIGAATRDTDVGRSAGAVPLLVKATPFIGHLHIRNRGTIGGSIAHADPAAEYPAVALALDASMEVLSPGGMRAVAAADFFQGVWTTDLAEDDLLTGVTFPKWSGRCGFAVEELARRHGDFAIAGAAVGVQADDGGAVTRCAIGLIGMSATPVRAPSAEAAAVSGADAAEVGRLAAADPVDVSSDLHGPAEYRRRVCAAVVARAFAAALEDAHG